MDGYVSLDTMVTIDGDQMPVYDTLTNYDSASQDPDDKFYLNNTEEVRFYLDRLSNNHRLVLEHKLILGYTHSEIADLLSISESYSQNLFKQGVDQLKSLVVGEEIEILQHKFKDAHQQSIQSNDETGADVWNDSFWKPEPPSAIKYFSQEEIDLYLKGDK